MIGQTLGHYRIESKLGAGGMGEVYRARDSRLGRDVALKVLPEIFAKDAERMARFEREAQVLASLNHPNIAVLYGLEESGGVRALVMELVEGPTLAERIAAGPIPLDEALPIAKQVAEAFEAAHERGIVHRDLKPANVKVKPNGAVKVLDFGLAKALDDDPSASDLRNSPTISIAATRAGVILGTAAYMSPEQAKGKPVDRRADIWAFGIVLLEMLTGRQVYGGETAAETLASVMLKDPSFDALPADTPAAIRKLLRRCLDKDPKHRLRDIGEARIAIEEALSGAPAEPAVVVPSPSLPLAPSPRRALFPWVAAAVLLVSTAALAFLYFRQTPPPERVLRYQISPPEKSSLHSFALSPDGRFLAMAIGVQGKNQLWVRPLDTLQGQSLPNTEGAQYPFWSPDSRYIGFFADGKLKKVAVNGGPAQTLCDAPSGRSGSWNRDVIVFAPAANGGIFRVAAVGGVPVQVTSTQAADRFPVFLPDGRHFLHVVVGDAPERNGVILASIDSKESRRVLADESSVAFAPPIGGSRQAHLLFIRENTLVAQPFDLKTLQPAGELFPVAEQVSFGPNTNFALVSISENGVLGYQTGSNLAQSQLAWYDRGGKQLSLVGAPGSLLDFALSPDEKTIAIPRFDARGAASDIWLHEIARGTETRFTFHASRHLAPVWSPSGDRIVFSSDRTGHFDMYQKASNGSGQDELLRQSANNKGAYQWSRDGRFLICGEFDSKTKQDLWVLPDPASPDRKPVSFLKTEFNELHAQLSPDNRWMAYTSDESGRREVYVRPFPAADSKWKISTAGGEQPRWSHDGKELFYLAADRKLMAAPVKTGLSGAKTSFEPGTPVPLFDTRIPPMPPGAPLFQYEVTRDAKRFLMVIGGEQAVQAPLTIAVNWQAGVKK